jgi:hypothetical protein
MKKITFFQFFFVDYNENCKIHSSFPRSSYLLNFLSEFLIPTTLILEINILNNLKRFAASQRIIEHRDFFKAESRLDNRKSN